MASFREIKRRARRDLHEKMRVPAYYLLETDPPENPHPDPEDPEYDPEWSPGLGPFYTEPALVHVRIRLKQVEQGDMVGTNFHFAERHEGVTRILFMREEVTPVRGAVVSVETGEAYRVDNVLDPDDISITAEVTALPAAETTGLPVPEPES